MANHRMRSIDNDKAYDAAAEEFGSICLRIDKAVDDLLSIADRLLDDENVDYTVQVYNEIAEFLATGYRPGNLWFWLRRRVAQLSEDSEEGIAFCIACFEPWTEPPVDFRDIELLFRFLDNPETSWMLFLAYDFAHGHEDFPNNIRRHYEKLEELAREEIVSRQIFEDELQSYMARSGEQMDNE